MTYDEPIPTEPADAPHQIVAPGHEGTGLAIDDLEHERNELRAAGKRLVGITGSGSITSLRSTLLSSGVGAYPLVALGLLAMVDQLQTTVLTIMGPEISNGIGIPKGTFALVLLVKTLIVTLAALPIAAAVQRRARRAAVCVLTAFFWAVMTGATAFVVSIWGLLLIAVLAGAATASVQAIHQPLLLDCYPPEARMRTLSAYRGFDSAGNLIGPLIVALSTVVLALTWRGAMVGVAIAGMAAALAACWLRDPGFGKWDTEQVRELVRHATGGDGAEVEPDVSLGFFEISRRLLLIRTVRKILTAFAVLGMLLAPFLTYMSFFLQERWGLGPGGRSLLFALMPVFGIVALRLFGPRGEATFREDPARLMRLSGAVMAVGVSGLALAVVAPWFGAMVVLFGVSLAALGVVTPAITLPLFSIVPAHMRPHLGALIGIFLTGVGGFAGVLLLGSMSDRFGPAGAIVSLAVPGIAAGLLIRSAGETVNDDLDRMVDQIVEEEELRSLAGQGVRLPLLACRNIDFSYGQMQVLFDVDFTVDDGEMVALLGTNGAGKSTLLRVIAGLGLPSKGSVRLRGSEITYLDAERRLRLGISQVPGGRAVFGPMTVVDNLRVMGYSHGRDRRAIEAGIDASFDAFPALSARRNQLASTLSGGEQQMLGLASALIVKPRVLCIDELSLGLAPKVVGELLEMVRGINREGTAVVLVEQSVNVALSIVQHAYFMEKGEIRFDGRADELLDRPDLLRSVFLDGAAGSFS